MTSTIVIGTKNYSGETAHITFYPETGGTINVGSHIVPYNYLTEYIFGTYELFFSAYNFTCNFTISSSNTIPPPQTITATTVEYDLFQRYTQDPELFPNNVLSATTLSGLNTNILIEQNFAGTFEGAISQFRMYITPMSAPEVKHNFNILKNTFRMFNPDCPDCSTITCVNDFEYEITDSTTTTTTYIPTTTTTTTIVPSTIFGLGRELKIDERDKKYLIENRLTLPKTTLTQRYWDDNGWWGDQGKTSQCVGYAWAHFIDDGPIKHLGPKPNTNPTLIYREAQKIDEWPGENYEGTSVRAGAKFLKKENKIGSYLWAYNLDTLIKTVLTQGPVVVGTNWYNGMFYPDRNGLIKISGRNMGGHAYVINGVDTRKQLFRIKNSWGRSWGVKGSAYISFANMQRLIRENGEICLAVENKF
jgi:hypothetical protein